MHSPTPKAPMNLGREPFRQLPCQLGLVRAIVLAYVETDLQQADELLRQPLVYVELLDALRFLEPSRFLCALTLHLCLCFCCSTWAVCCTFRWLSMSRAFVIMA